MAKIGWLYNTYTLASRCGLRCEIINKNIPLDPIGFDWNEFAKSKSEFFKIYFGKKLTNRVFGLLSGLIISVASLIISPSWLDIIVLLFTLLLFIFQNTTSDTSSKLRNNYEPLPLLSFVFI